MREGSKGTIEWLTPHLAHRVPSLREGERSIDCGAEGGCEGGTHAILRHIICESWGEDVDGRGSEIGRAHV